MSACRLSQPNMLSPCSDSVFEMNFRIGCAIWAYKGWVGNLFPSESRSSDFLRLYGQRFTTVEGNTTFYAIPDAATIRRWATETPDGFQFCLKLPKVLTHLGPLETQIPDTLRFLDLIQGLGSRLGPTFAQLPPTYGPNRLGDLETFLTALPLNTMDLALEVRHPAWFQEPHASRLTDLLEQLQIGRVLLDTRPIYDVPDDPQLQAERRKPRLPLIFSLTAGFSLIRYVSHPNLQMNQSFMAEWISHITTWLNQGIRIYWFVHCPVEERSPTNARHFQQLLEQHQAPIPPLPWKTLDPPSDQLSLF